MSEMVLKKKGFLTLKFEGDKGKESHPPVSIDIVRANNFFASVNPPRSADEEDSTAMVEVDDSNPDATEQPAKPEKPVTAQEARAWVEAIDKSRDYLIDLGCPVDFLSHEQVMDIRAEVFRQVREQMGKGEPGRRNSRLPGLPSGSTTPASSMPSPTDF